MSPQSWSFTLQWRVPLMYDMLCVIYMVYVVICMFVCESLWRILCRSRNGVVSDFDIVPPWTVKDQSSQAWSFFFALALWMTCRRGCMNATAWMSTYAYICTIIDSTYQSYACEQYTMQCVHARLHATCSVCHIMCMYMYVHVLPLKCVGRSCLQYTLRRLAA